MERERINPPTLFQHPAFTRVLTVKGPCKFIFIAGLTAADMNYKCVAPGDCRAQYINILENLTVQLEAAGATWDDVVFRRIYALDVDAFLKVQAEVATPGVSGSAPPSTLIGVTRLSSPDFVLEKTDGSRHDSGKAGPAPPMDHRSRSGINLPGDEAWLIGEHRSSGEMKYHLANLPAAASLRTLAATIKARWICGQAHQQLKEELGLDHFEGRSWQGLHRHALMTMLAFAFLQHRRLKTARRGKKINGPPRQPSLPSVRHAIVALIAQLPSKRCPHCRKWIGIEKRR